MVVIEHACSVVEDVSIDLTKRDQGLERMSQWMVESYHEGYGEGKWSPTDLHEGPVSMKLSLNSPKERTAVTVSMHKTNGSAVRYLESAKAYSFQNCPKRSCFPAKFT